MTKRRLWQTATAVAAILTICASLTVAIAAGRNVKQPPRLHRALLRALSRSRHISMRRSHGDALPRAPKTPSVAVGPDPFVAPVPGARSPRPIFRVSDIPGMDTGFLGRHVVTGTIVEPIKPKIDDSVLALDGTDIRMDGVLFGDGVYTIVKVRGQDYAAVPGGLVGDGDRVFQITANSTLLRNPSGGLDLVRMVQTKAGSIVD